MNKRILQNSFCISLAAILAFTPYSAYAMSQDETVYAKLHTDGATNYISVTEHLLNDGKTSQLSDQTILENIENLNGFEGFVFDGENLIWDTNGNDIYYSGTTTKELPIQLQITYKLNDEEKTADEMLGKSGKVEIHLHFTNLSKVGDLHTPFVAAIATALPENSTHNATVTNGKVISNGRTIAVTAIAAPGLYDSLKLADLKTLDDVVLTYDTDNFELNDIYTMITPKVLNADDLKTFSELDQLYDDMNTLSESSKQLLAGTNALRNGILELRNAVASVKQQLSTTGELVDSATLDQIANTAADAARRKVATQQDSIKAQIHQQVSGMLSNETIMQLNNLKQAMIAQNVAEKCGAPSGSYNTTITVQDVIIDGEDADIIEDNNADNDQTTDQYEICKKQVTEAINNQFASLLDTSAIETQLFNSTYGAMKQVAAETASQTARSVATQVASSIQEGMGEKLGLVIDEVLKGLNQLLAGANELNAGMYKFDDEGIQMLNNFVNRTVRDTSYKVQRLLKLADEYNNFAGIADGTNGSTKFVLMVEARK